MGFEIMEILRIITCDTWQVNKVLFRVKEAARFVISIGLSIQQCPSFDYLSTVCVVNPADLFAL